MKQPPPIVVPPHPLARSVTIPPLKEEVAPPYPPPPSRVERAQTESQACTDAARRTFEALATAPAAPLPPLAELTRVETAPSTVTIPRASKDASKDYGSMRGPYVAGSAEPRWAPHGTPRVRYADASSTATGSAGFNVKL